MKKSFLWILLPALAMIPVIYFSITKLNSTAIQEERLAKKYCTSCHIYPDPSLLPKNIWVEHVLPEMGLRLGIGDKNTLLQRMPFKLFDQLNNLGIYPDTNLISQNDWLSVVHFYETNAHENGIAHKSTNRISNTSNHFKQELIFSDSSQSAQTTMVRFRPAQKEIWLASSLKVVEKFSIDLNVKSTMRTPSAVVDVVDEVGQTYLSIGNILPNEDRNGQIFTIGDQAQKGTLLIDSLHRPVQMLKSDMDKDGVDDLVILEYGFETGQVQLVDGKTGVSSILSHQPGARNIHLRDIDKDGFPDLYILFAQAREQVSLFHNLGDGNFKEEIVLQFPSVHGSSFLDIADMNGDGFDDMILSNGDNADYSILRKSFHGVRIFLNNGKDQFKESWFYPAYGATKTLAGDFDNDGDQDMAMIAFFSEVDKGSSFLYFENKQSMHFNVSTLGVPDARWLVMESADMDKDGDLDLILGNFEFGMVEAGYLNSKNIKALILRNTVR